MSAIQTLAVIGAGQMGAGIAEVAAGAGIDVLLCDASLAVATTSKARLLERLDKLVAKGKVGAEARESIARGVVPLDFEPAIERADVVIEAAPEQPELKKELFRRIDALAPTHALLASNTSSVSITLLAGQTRRPAQVAGMHFMNPVPLMKLVEIVRGVETSEATLDAIRALAERLGKTVIVSQDRPGFLVNRVLLPLVNEACFALQEGIGSAEDIDQGARLGLNHPLGPLELADLIGLDTVLAIAEVLAREIGEDKYRPASILRNLVAAGRLGRKTGRGFYEYDAAGRKIARPSTEPRP